ncbi:c-type cytochrome [Jiella pelagia]|uniref:Cytochrome c n=1 Tax=Jiella pelagia TaxID=2986949 RepID=A0ABY7C6F9_9HYPH|nr:cytochrome c [Jiella pelagia]WAP71427.1 cytochrome c [Jiella pelagia]
MTKKFGAGLALGIVGTLLIAVAVWLTVAYTGAYNVAASDQHADVVRWTLDTTMRRSVASRAGGVELPENVSENLLAEGAGHYSESCAHCHGAPGSEPAEWSRGMRPEPPHLVEAASEWTPEEIHWIVSNGIKMSGMPAFGKSHSPEAIVALTAFVSALPGLTADDYARLSGSAEDHAEQPQAGTEDGSNREPEGGAPESPLQ